MLLRIHSSHQGAESCIRRAKDVLFSPGMTSEIKEREGQCSTCNEYLSKQQKEPLMTYKIPTRPWKMVAQDLLTINSSKLDIHGNQYNKWLDNVITNSLI